MESRADIEAAAELNQSTGTETAETSLNSSIASVDLEEDFTEEELKKAEEYKTKGNEAFKNGQFEPALDFYSEAIFCKVPKNKKAVYYCNRALVNLKLENNALALFDANDSIKCDETFAKAYYRRGSAHVALNQLKEAVGDFKKVCQLLPNDRDAREKYQLTLKEHKAKEFAKCIEKEDIRVNIKLDEIIVEASYDGPRLESIDDLTPDWVVSMMDYYKNQKVLHKKYATMIILKCRDIFQKNNSLVHIQVPDIGEVTVCGDIHGQYYDLLNIFSINGNPSETNPYLFNGDFIDRGSFSVEVIVTLLAWKALLPNHMFMARGNHESKNLNKMYGFEGEVKHKYDVKTYDLFSEVFCYLPLAHCINNKIFVTHGGLFSKDGIKIKDIEKVNRVREPPDEGIMCECLWSDPSDTDGRHPSKRGVAIQFGPDVAQRFIDDNDLKLVVRSHEVKHEGFEYQKGGKVLTVFSAPNYCDQMGNKGAFVRFNGRDLEPKITSFDKVEHPKVPPMAYAKQKSIIMESSVNDSTAAAKALDMKRLAAYCFDSIIAKLEKRETPAYPAGMEDPEYPIFVTWTKGPEEDLRGCIGTFASQRLSQILGKYAMISAFQDSRFDPISKAEVPNLQCGVSLLVNFTPIQDPLDWEVGKHGIEIDFRANGRNFSGTFLPEVAPDQGWNQLQTLEYLVRKAGYRGKYDDVKAAMQAKTYESKKIKMSYEEYQNFRVSV